MSLSAQEVAQLAYNAGFRGSELRMAVAIAEAESNFNPRAYNPEVAAGTRPGSGSRGLWQIYGQAHPEYNSDALFNPQLNANAAYAVFREAGNSFRPWSTFNNGSAYQHAQGLQLDTSSETLNARAPLAVSAIGGGLATVGGGGIFTPQMQTGITDTASAVTAGAVATGQGLINIQLLPDSVQQFLSDPETPKTIIVGALGLILFVIGWIILIVQLSRPAIESAAQTATQAAVGIAKTAVTKGVL